LPSLEILDLSHNSISKIDQKLFAKNPNLKVSKFTAKKKFIPNKKKILPKKFLRFLT
jgi:Leucine-rich repeat (LRR) protein